MALPISQQLADLLGGDAVIMPERWSDYAIDGLTPQVVAQPSHREGIAQMLRWAWENQLTVFPRGGGTQLALGNVPSRVDLVLDLSRYNHVLDYQPADLTVTVAAGINLETLQQHLAQGGKYLPLEAPMPEKATIGGILAANTSGPSRFTYGLAREWLIGINVVSASGVETRAGGKVVKNVTGYDLNKLYTGSLGTLGVIVEATFKLSPLPAASGTLVAAFPSILEGTGAAQALLRQVFAPQALQVVDALVARRLGIDSSRGGWWSSLEEGGSVAVAFFSGRPRTVQRKLDEATHLLQDRGATEAGVIRESPLTGSSLLRQLTDLGWTMDTMPYLSLKVNVPPSTVAQVVGEAQGISALGYFPGIIADPSFGMVRLLWWTETSTRDISPHTPAETVIPEVIHQLRSLARRSGGSVVVEHCPLSVKHQIDVWGDGPEGIEIMRRIKQQFDPQGILNPGRFVGRI